MTLRESLRKILDQPREQFGDRFYEKLLKAHPEMAQHFRQTNLAHQAAFLSVALTVIVEHAEHPRQVTSEYLRILGHRHDLRKIDKHLYEPFAAVLLENLAAVHGSEWTPELQQQWRQAIAAAAQKMTEGYVAGPLTY